MESTSKYPTQRAAGREHFPVYPKGFIAIRILQLIIAVICLGLCAYGVTVLAFSGDSLMLFTAVATMIVTIYYIVAEFSVPLMYNYWAVIALDIFLVIFWLISFALLASQVAPAFSGVRYCTYYGTCYTAKLSGEVLVYASCLAAAAGLGGLNFLLFIISLVFVGIRVNQHRSAGLHSQPGVAPGPAAAPAAAGVAAAAAPAAAEKYEGQPAQPMYPQQTGGSQPYVQQPQAAYGQPGQQMPPPQHMYATPPQQTQSLYSQQSPQQPQYPQQFAQQYPQQYPPQHIPQQSPSPLTVQQTGTSQYSQPSQPPVVHHELDHSAPNYGPYEAPAEPVDHAQQPQVHPPTQTQHQVNQS